MLQCVGDAPAEIRWRLVEAPTLDDDPQLGLEVERLEAGRAVVDVLLDQDPLLLGELTVQVVVHEVERFLTLVVTLTH